MKKVSKTEKLRQSIAEFLKSENGKLIRQKDLIDHFITDGSEYTSGMIRGIFNKMDGVGGIYIPIPNVESIKEDNKAFYRYINPGKPKFETESKLHELGNKIMKFEEELKNENYFNIDLRLLKEEEIQSYISFTKKFEALKNCFVEE